MTTLEQELNKEGWTKQFAFYVLDKETLLL